MITATARGDDEVRGEDDVRDDEVRLLFLELMGDIDFDSAVAGDGELLLDEITSLVLGIITTWLASAWWTAPVRS